MGLSSIISSIQIFVAEISEKMKVLELKNRELLQEAELSAGEYSPPPTPDLYWMPCQRPLLTVTH
jgi:hypothetical protein